MNVDTQPVALALIEAKKESLPPGHGLDQAKSYAECRRHNVQFIFTSDGQRIAEVLRVQMASVEEGPRATARSTGNHQCPACGPVASGVQWGVVK
ncbi:MAG: hypothetical protein NTW71_08235 [Deltaproteobacteria bacterium]|nr:hypothetical protein [Deltaproteobacteria bacterium]